MNHIKQRIEWLDMAKGYGILAVIYAHLRAGISTSFIYSFHVPLFFLLSGYVFSAKDSFSTFLKKRSKSMLIPYFCLGIPMILFDRLGYQNAAYYTLADWISTVLDFLIQRRLWTLWFLSCLFFLNIFFYAAVRILKSNTKLIIFTIIITTIGLLYYEMGGKPLPWNIDVCFTAFPFFLVGYLYKENRIAIDTYLDNTKASATLFTIFAACNLTFNYLTYLIAGNGLEMFRCRYGFPPFTYISAFAGIFCVIILSKRFTIKSIRYIGENSLIYFAWHQTIMIPISVKCLELFHFTINRTSSFLAVVAYKMLQLIIIITALTICSIILTRTKLKLILGK